MRVLHLTTEYPPVIYGGLGTAVGGWVRACARDGISVAVQLVEGPLVLDGREFAERYGGYGYGSGHGTLGRSRRPPSEAVVGNDDVLFFQSSWANALEIGIRAVRSWQADVVHLHTAMLWYVAAGIRTATGTNVVYHVHSVDRAEYEIGDEPNLWLAHSDAQAQAITGSDVLIALTDAEGKLLNHYYPGARQRIRVVGNGIEDTAPARAAAFTRTGVAGEPVVLYSGRLVERKGVRELLDAIPAVLETTPDATFVFAGGPPPLTGAEVAAQWLRHQHEPCRDRIRFTGWLSPKQVAAWYEAADILVVPSRYEPFGMVILEGMLHGLAVVAAGAGGPAAILEHRRTGLLFPPRDVPALVAALRWLLENPHERRKIGDAAAHEVRDKWSWHRRVCEMRAVYEDCLGHDRQRHALALAL